MAVVPLPVEPFNPQRPPGVPTPTTTKDSGPKKTGTTGGPVPSIVGYSRKLLRPALTSHYVCRFQPPENCLSFLKKSESLFPGAYYNSPLNQELIELSCTEASLPGSSLMTNEINDDYTGVTERFAYRRQYDDRIDFTFYVDHDYRIINFFERWISYCVAEDSLKEVDDKNYNYRVNFPDDYQTDALYVTKFERDVYDSIAMEYKFIRAYPISITSMPITYDSSQLLKCTVSFSYIRYVRKMLKSGKPTVVGAQQNPDGTWNVDILINGNVETITVTNEEYQRKYAPR